MVVATRGFHPLPFEHLDPHRFEDLVRQLAYEFRVWRKLEATGRAGSDDGFDARGWEIVGEADASATAAEGNEEDEQQVAATEDRIWLIQCKREKAIGPKKLIQYVDAIPPEEMKGLYGIVFAAACDFSKPARDRFREKCATLGVSECYLWGKGELEDMLYQPKNDHLLFAYFGVSLTIRRRSVRTELRSRLAMKKKALRILEKTGWQHVLIRDPEERRYPFRSKIPDFDTKPTWLVTRYAESDYSGLLFVRRRFMAYLDNKGEEWDAALALNDERPSRHDDPWREDDDEDKDSDLRQRIMNDVWDKFPEQNKAWLEVLGILPFENILDIDEIGDDWVKHPHIYAPFKNGTPFIGSYAKVESIGQFDRRSRYVNQEDEGRIEMFPAEVRVFPAKSESKKKAG